MAMTLLAYKQRLALGLYRVVTAVLRNGISTDGGRWFSSIELVNAGLSVGT